MLLDIRYYSGRASHSYRLHDSSTNAYHHCDLRTQVTQMGYSDSKEAIAMKCSIDNGSSVRLCVIGRLLSTYP